MVSEIIVTTTNVSEIKSTKKKEIKKTVKNGRLKPKYCRFNYYPEIIDYKRKAHSYGSV